MNIKKILAVVAATIVLSVTAVAQNACPGITIDQRVDHRRSQLHINMGWDTAVTCEKPMMILTSTVFVPYEYFNGHYKVESIPYDPPESFDLRSMLHGTEYDSATYNYPANGPVQKLNIPNDDMFDADTIKIDFPFSFFGYIKTGAVVGDNGMLTFNTQAASSINPPTGGRQFWGNAYANFHPIPWDSDDKFPTSAVSGPVRNENHLDAVYVLYTDGDTRPSSSNNVVGIFKGVVDSAAYFPCRRIVVSWDSISPYGHTSTHKNSFMVVCYEGTNIIEIHCKNFHAGSPSGEKAIVGIQNKTGQEQVSYDDDEHEVEYINGTDTFRVNPLREILDHSPAAFWPDTSNGSNRNYNLFKTNDPDYDCQERCDTVFERAWRFTPQGSSRPEVHYYRIMTSSHGNDSLAELSRKIDYDNDPDPVDSNGWYWYKDIPNEDDGLCNIEAHIEPTVTSRYVAEIIFRGATGFKYILRDTITVGVDTMKTYSVRTLSQNVCQDDSAIFDIVYGPAMQEIDPDMQRIDTVKWEIYQISNGTPTDITNSSRIVLENRNKHVTVKASATGIDKVDTIMLRSRVEFRNGCDTIDTIYTYMYPLYSIDTNAEICKDAAPFRWQGKTYDRIGLTEDSVKLRTRVGNCDSVLHLHLKISDTMSTPQYVDTCDSYTWRNGKTYTRNNDVDTIVLHTALAGCDSVIRLHLRIHPYEAAIRVDPEFATLDQLDIELTDISTGTESRIWVMPDSSQNTTQSVLYTMPFEADSAVFWLYAKSDNGECYDTARVMVPMQRETFWIPNVILPDDAAGNNIFRISTTQANDLECYIYNRQGQLVGHFEGIDGSWDCRDLNGNPVPQGSYVYVIRYTTVWHPEQTLVRKGTITLIR